MPALGSTGAEVPGSSVVVPTKPRVTPPPPQATVAVIPAAARIARIVGESHGSRVTVSVITRAIDKII